jgi:UDP-2,3-diacylglucosamine pyrophosphatase LpxH
MRCYASVNGDDLTSASYVIDAVRLFSCHQLLYMRKPGVVVVSDLHLGTIGCHAKEVLSYLQSIEPEILVLNGDIIDIWQFSKHYWPQSHTLVLQRLMEMASKGTQVYYLTGNHDELLRRFSPIYLGDIRLLDKLVIELDGKKAWFFHGDVFDFSVKHSKWIAKLGAIGYDTLIVLNRLVNRLRLMLGKSRTSFSSNIKNGVKKAVDHINDFEKTVAELAIEKGYAFVVCGHIHQPSIQDIHTTSGSVRYLNAGDWVESLTALEYSQGEWSLYTHPAVNADMPLKKAAPHPVFEERFFMDTALELSYMSAR